jgi:ketosteroid isomerase-like protein
MAEHPNARTLRRFYACFGEADYLARVRDFLAPQVVWHIAGDNPLAGQLHGIDAVTEQMRRYSDLSAGTLRLDTYIMASDTQAVASTARGPQSWARATTRTRSTFPHRR